MRNLLIAAVFHEALPSYWTVYTETLTDCSCILSNIIILRNPVELPVDNVFLTVAKFLPISIYMSHTVINAQAMAYST